MMKQSVAKYFKFKFNSGTASYFHINLKYMEPCDHPEKLRSIYIETTDIPNPNTVTEAE